MTVTRLGLLIQKYLRIGSNTTGSVSSEVTTYKSNTSGSVSSEVTTYKSNTTGCGSSEVMT